MTGHHAKQIDLAGAARWWVFAGLLTLVPMALFGCGERPGSSVGAIVDERIERELVREGDGDLVLPGRRIEVHYKRFGPNGRVMVDTRSRGRPHDWVIGDRSTFLGLDRAVRGMQEGSIWNVTIPPDLHESYLRRDAGDDETGTPRTAGPVKYRIEIVRVGMPLAIVDSRENRVMPYVAPKRNPDARPSQFPLVNATRGWGH